MLESYGVLLESDPKLPSVCAIIAGSPIKGSWWGHAQGHAIFRINRQLAGHPDVLVAKLVSGKVTFVHRELWPAVVAIGAARELWQLKNLSRAARSLLDRVTWEGELQAAGAPARELETVLLVFSQQIHTPSGAHAKRLLSWERWADRMGLPEIRVTPEQARKQLEDRMAALNVQFGAKGRLHWTAFR